MIKVGGTIGLERESPVEVVVGCRLWIGGFACERQACRTVIYYLEELAGPERARLLRLSKEPDVVPNIRVQRCALVQWYL